MRQVNTVLGAQRSAAMAVKDSGVITLTGHVQMAVRMVTKDHFVLIVSLF